ncbi:gliding motility lipoprotein GldH [Tenacibaculum holothuriorum]|uniref:gliding motility lipoprotein GldH n=1 Tax=Tenacibaculum holothuriorum TaxID=1635173 RepID=UPI000A3248E1|nr:gliding motility lipoprotein GldH [Tenacibaculum holothuriorum]
MPETKTEILKKLSSILSVVLVTLNFLSCDKKREYDEYKTIPNSTWHKENEVAFTFSITDTVQRKNVFINLRNNKSYPFSNLFVITEMKFPDGNKVIDTLEYDMADVTGKFLGTGFTDIKENKLFYKEHILFPTSGDYSFKIRQAMRKNGDVNGVETLDGITDVGLRIEKIQ